MESAATILTMNLCGPCLFGTNSLLYAVACCSMPNMATNIRRYLPRFVVVRLLYAVKDCTRTLVFRLAEQRRFGKGRRLFAQPAEAEERSRKAAAQFLYNNGSTWTTEEQAQLDDMFQAVQASKREESARDASRPAEPSSPKRRKLEESEESRRDKIDYVDLTDTKLAPTWRSVAESLSFSLPAQGADSVSEKLQQLAKEDNNAGVAVAAFIDVAKDSRAATIDADDSPAGLSEHRDRIKLLARWGFQDLHKQYVDALGGAGQRQT
eukprot:s3546_g4.t1